MFKDELDTILEKHRQLQRSKQNDAQELQEKENAVRGKSVAVLATVVKQVFDDASNQLRTAGHKVEVACLTDDIALPEIRLILWPDLGEASASIKFVHTVKGTIALETTDLCSDKPLVKTPTAPTASWDPGSLKADQVEKYLLGFLKNTLAQATGTAPVRGRG